MYSDNENQQTNDSLLATGKSDRSGSSRVLIAVRVVTALVVSIWIVRTIWIARDDIVAEGFMLADFKLRFLAMASFSYVFGLVFFALFWHRSLQAMGQNPKLVESFGSYFLSHLGKYVPGKALVVVIRSDRVASDRVQRGVAVIAVFVETLGMMAVGGVFASALLIAGYGNAHQSGGLIMLAIGLAISTGVAASPPLFRRIIKQICVRRGLTKINDAITGLTWRVILHGWALSAVGWLFLGLSLVLVIESFPHASSNLLLSISDYPQVFAAVALAMVAGFVSMLPGGAGVREAVIMKLLAPVVGTSVAILSAVVLRLVWLLCETGLSAVFYCRSRAAKTT